MIEAGNTIVYRDVNGTLKFYWLCSFLPEGYLFFSWFGNIHHATADDYWVMTREWFESKVKAGTIEVYPDLPLDRYGETFNKQAMERNR